MELIDKSTLVTEIEKLQKVYSTLPTRNNYEDGLKEGRLIGYKDALHKINSLEVKEVNLEEESYNIFKHRFLFLIDSNEEAYLFAKHFFELGLKIKGE